MPLETIAVTTLDLLISPAYNYFTGNAMYYSSNRETFITLVVGKHSFTTLLFGSWGAERNGLGGARYYRSSQSFSINLRTFMLMKMRVIALTVSQESAMGVMNTHADKIIKKC